MIRLIGSLVVLLWSGFGAHGQETLSLAYEYAKAEESYRYLQSLPAQWAGFGTNAELHGEQDCRTYDSAHIRLLTPKMAMNTAAMARAYKEETGIELMVLSAYRSPEDQECACKNVAGHCAGWRRITVGKDAEGRSIFRMEKTGIRSHHENGTAIDMRPADVDVRDKKALAQAFAQFHAWLHKRAQSFGLYHPLFANGDRAHVELYEPENNTLTQIRKKLRRFKRK